MSTEFHCFCELVPLYALDALEQPERWWIEQQLSICPELREELADYELAVTAFSYEAPMAPLSANLKQRLFDRLALESISSRQSPTAQSTPSAVVRSQDLQWQPYQVTGVEVAILHADPLTREVTGVLRAAAGVRYPAHCHAAIEEIYMLSGELVIDQEIYGAGDYIRSLAGSSHAPHTDIGCMFFFRTSLDDEYPDRVLTLQ